MTEDDPLPRCSFCGHDMETRFAVFENLERTCGICDECVERLKSDLDGVDLLLTELDRNATRH